MNTLEQDKSIIENAPEDGTATVFTFHTESPQQVSYWKHEGIWLRYEFNCPEITCCKEWVADADIEDQENIRSLSDIRDKIAQAEENEQLKAKIAELKAMVDACILTMRACVKDHNQ